MVAIAVVAMFGFLQQKDINRVSCINWQVANSASFVPVDDKKTFEMLARGETEGLFQLNGDGMTRALKELKPTVIHDINVMVALVS